MLVTGRYLNLFKIQRILGDLIDSLIILYFEMIIEKHLIITIMN